MVLSTRGKKTMKRLCKFETVYKRSKQWVRGTKCEGNSLKFYQAFRNETNFNFRLNPDDTDNKVNQPERVYIKLVNKMTLKEMCWQYYRACCEIRQLEYSQHE